MLKLFAVLATVAGLACAADQKPAASKGKNIAKTSAKAGDPAKGKAVFAAQNCNTCHSTGTDRIMGPGLKGVFSRPKLANGKKPSEEAISSVIDQGGNGMPPYKDMLKSSEKTDLIAYLKTL
ncbi:MAG TPA: cytochrome c [Bryobacteraceae bacterium]|nr:cytochrome c [Bryobacteraceae bacterium]